MNTGIRLRVVHGLSTPSEVYGLYQPVTKIGRSKHCEIQINVPQFPLEAATLVKTFQGFELQWVGEGAKWISGIAPGPVNVGAQFIIHPGIQVIAEEGPQGDELMSLPLQIKPGEKDLRSNFGVKPQKIQLKRPRSMIRQWFLRGVVLAIGGLFWFYREEVLDFAQTLFKLKTK